MNKILIGIFTAATVGFCHADEFKDFKKAIVEESRDMAAFENPEFEDVSKYGTVNENVEIGRFGFNGNGGMRLRPLNKKLSWALPFKGRLEKGRRYIFSADVRRHGSVSFQAAGDVYYRRWMTGGCGRRLSLSPKTSRTILRTNLWFIRLCRTMPM